MGLPERMECHSIRGQFRGVDYGDRGDRGVRTITDNEGKVVVVADVGAGITDVEAAA